MSRDVRYIPASGEAYVVALIVCYIGFATGSAYLPVALSFLGFFALLMLFFTVLEFIVQRNVWSLVFQMLAILLGLLPGLVIAGRRASWF